MKALIKEKKLIAEETLEVTFDLQGKEIDFNPGQYFFVTLLNPPFTDERGTIRHFSIVNPPTAGGILTMATRIRDTAFKKILEDLPVGAEVEVNSVEGNFVLPEKTDEPLVFLTGGIGITPFMSMLGYIRDKKLPYRVTLFYANRNRASTAFYDELEALAREIPNFRVIFIMSEDDRWPGEKGRIGEELIRKYSDDLSSPIYYLAGPPTMVKDLSQVLAEMGIERKRIITENFSGY